MFFQVTFRDYREKVFFIKLLINSVAVFSSLKPEKQFEISQALRYFP